MMDREVAPSRTWLSRRAVWPYFAAALALLIVWIGIKATRVLAATRSLQESQLRAEQIAGDGFANADVEEAHDLLLDIRTDLLIVKSETALLMPILPRLSGLPSIGATLAAAPHLLAMADQGTESALTAFRGLKPGLELFLEADAGSDSMIPRMIQVLRSAEADLVRAEELMGGVMESRAQMGDASPLPFRIRSLIAQIDPWLPLAKDGLRMAQLLPDLVGYDGTKRYLLITQNEDEIRPTGGFISGAGLLEVAGGQIVGLNLGDAYGVDNWRQKPYELPPAPLYELMGLELFLFRDANYWPDFPTSAEKLMALYSYGQETPSLDGVIAIDQRMVQTLLRMTGPIEIPESGRLIDSGNVIDSFREEWSFQADPESAEWREWYQNRKAFIGVFASALRTQFETNLSNVDPATLVQELWRATSEKQMQLYLRDPESANLIGELGWDGRLHVPTGYDLVGVIDTNVGYNKANVYVERAIEYRVSLEARGTAEAELVVVYSHRRPQRSEPCVQDLSYAFDQVSNYLNLADRCYWNYLRIYVPSGSDLSEATAHLVPAESLHASNGRWSANHQGFSEASGLITFDNFLMLPWGETVMSRYKYELSPSVSSRTMDEQAYDLILFKQAGMRPEPVRISVMLPPDARLAEVTPEPASVGAGRVDFEFALTQDTVVSLRFEAADGSAKE